MNFVRISDVKGLHDDAVVVFVFGEIEYVFKKRELDGLVVDVPHDGTIHVRSEFKKYVYVVDENTAKWILESFRQLRFEGNMCVPMFTLGRGDAPVKLAPESFHDLPMDARINLYFTVGRHTACIALTKADLHGTFYIWRTQDRSSITLGSVLYESQKRFRKHEKRTIEINLKRIATGEAWDDDFSLVYLPGPLSKSPHRDDDCSIM